LALTWLRKTFITTMFAALAKDGWTITDDPFRLRWGKKDYYVDLGAEELIAAEMPGRRIAVEIKSFVGASIVDDMEKALGSIVRS
jgi:hypothetical protein